MSQSICDIIFVGDESNSWYHGKISGIEGSGIVNLKSHLRNLTSCYNDVIVLGASMGGHAALHFHDCNWVSQVIALQPQLFVKKGWPRSRSCNLGRDVQPPPCYEQSSDRPYVALIVGQLDLFDIYQASLFLRSRFALDATIVPKAYHNVCYHWHRLGILERAIKLFISGTYQSGSSPYGKPYQELLLPELSEHVSVVPEIDKYYQLLYEGSGGSIEGLDLISSLADRFPKWTSIKVALALHAARNGLFEQSYKDLSLTSLSLEDRYGPLALYHYDRGEYDIFEEYLLQAVKYNAVSPTDSFISTHLPRLYGHSRKSYDLCNRLTILGLAEKYPLAVSTFNNCTGQ